MGLIVHRSVFCFIAASLIVGSARGSSPLDLSITKLDLPKITIAVKNTDTKRTMRLWKRGMSWGDDTIHFEFKDRDGKPAGEVRSAPRYYTGNLPLAYELKPEQSEVFSFDLGDSREWLPPKGIDYGHAEGVAVRVVLRQHLERDSHTRHVFAGEVRSPWTDDKAAHGAGSCIEWSAVPAAADDNALAGELFVTLLPALRIPQDDAGKTLLDRLGTNLRWDTVGLIAEPPLGSNHSQIFATLLFADGIAITFRWDAAESLGDTERKRLASALQLKRLGDGAIDQPGWAVASDVLRNVPVRGVVEIIVFGQNRIFAENRIFGEHWHLKRDGSFQKANR